MGTSSIFGGNKDRNPLLPADYAGQSEQDEKNVTWKSTKTNMSKYVTSGGKHGSANHIIRQAIKANGGAHRMAMNSSSGVRAARNIGGLFSNIRENGISATFLQLGIQYEGKSVREIFSHLINVIAPASETKEDIVAREASQAALSNVYDYVAENNMDLNCVEYMPIEVMDISMKAFLTEYIWGSVMKDLECRVEKYMEDVSSAFEREKEIKDTIESVVDVEYDNHSLLIQGDVNEAVSKLTERCFEVLEGII